MNVLRSHLQFHCCCLLPAYTITINPHFGLSQFLEGYFFFYSVCKLAEVRHGKKKSFEVVLRETVKFNFLEFMLKKFIWVTWENHSGRTCLT